MTSETTEMRRLTDIAERLLTDTGSAIEHRCSQGAPIPQYSRLVELIGDLRDVLFPRFRDQCSGMTVHAQLDRAADSLTELICQAFVTDGSHHERAPSKLALDFLSQLPEIRNDLLTDMQAAYDGDPACKSTDEVVLCYPGFKAVTIYRLAHRLHQMQVPLLPRMMSEWVHGETGIDIHPGARIGRHFFIDHGTGVVIGATCVIGEHVKIYQSVTLGALSFQRDEDGELIRDEKRHPTIGDRVVIYANATVLGGDTVVGHGSVIGSSVWLMQSVDPQTTVIMEKPKLRMRNQAPSDLEFPLDFQI